MKTNKEGVKLPVVLVVSKSELGDTVFEVGRDRKYGTAFYYDVVETQRQAAKRIKQLSENGYEVIGTIIDEPYTHEWEKFWPIVEVGLGEVVINRQKVTGKQWNVATEELLEIILYEYIAGTP